ncbi:MAG: superoxide dismutase family protein [Clostridia bacterium]|nr:superoxide dismutase family protein [Clostridia bacterium]
MYNPQIRFNPSAILRQRPQASAQLAGDGEHMSIRGEVKFWQTPQGVFVAAEVTGLPSPAGPCKSPVFGFHIHEGGSCTGNAADPFADAMTHFNPGNCPHPHHAGDLPPLFGNNGHAYMTVLTDRFAVRDIIGKTVIIHANPDDFTTQPSGNSGMKIACGVIETRY